MIRRATIEDYPQWVDLISRLRDQTGYAHIEPDRALVSKVYGRCLSSTLGCVLVAEHDRKITGTLVGVAQELWWSRRKYATDLLFYAETAGDGLRLIKTFMNWAWASPMVEEVILGQTSGLNVKRIGKVYRRAGLVKVGTLYRQMRHERTTAQQRATG